MCVCGGGGGHEGRATRVGVHVDKCMFSANIQV